MDREGLLRLDLWFHAALAQTTGNAILCDTAQRLHQRSAQLWSSGVSDRARYQLVYQQHSDIVEALAERDAKRARQAITKHISIFTEKTK